MRDFADESDQQVAYQAILEYLVSKGKYANVTEADTDASERVRFCEEIDLFDDDEQMRDASIHEKKLQVLINANGLQDIIAENDGDISRLNHTDAIQPPPSREEVAISLETEPVVAHNAEALAFEQETHAPSTMEQDSDSVKRNPLLQTVLHLGRSAIAISILLVSLAHMFNSEQQLQIIKYGCIVFTVLLFIFVGLYEVSSKILSRIRFTFGYSLFITSAILSGLLLMQQWSMSTFTFYDGLQGLAVNPVIHSLLNIGPYWLGICFAAMAALSFIAVQRAGAAQKNSINE